MVSGDIEINIAEISEDILLGLEGDFTGAIWQRMQIEDSPTLNELAMSDLFYKVALAVIWAPTRTTELRLTGGYKDGGGILNDADVELRDGTDLTGELEYDTPFIGVNIDPGWTLFGRSTEVFGVFNVDTDLNVVVDDEVLYRSNPRPDFEAGMAIKVRR